MDLVLTNPESMHRFLVDIIIAELSLEADSPATFDPDSALARGQKNKLKTYSDYVFSEQDTFLPLVFDSWGGTHPRTLEFLEEISTVMAQEDEQLKNQILRGFRDKITIAIHEFQGTIIERLQVHQKVRTV